MSGSAQVIPDEILLQIFTMVPWLDDLLNCSQVNHRWWHLVSQRLAKVKKLLLNGGTKANCFGHDFITKRLTNDILISNYIKILPNLETVETEVLSPNQWKDFTDTLRERNQITGLLYNWMSRLPVPILNNLQHVSKLSVGCFQLDGFDSKVAWYQHLKDLQVRYCDDRGLIEISRNFRKLRRLHLDFYNGISLSCYEGLAWESLEILELCVWRDAIVFHSKPILDSCPKLKSLFIRLDNVNYNFQPKQVHEELNNLVIDYPIGHPGIEKDCQDLMHFISKFPNVKNLGIHGHTWINYQQINSILRMLPSLEILDLRGCSKLDLDRNRSESLNNLNNRSRVTIYSGQSYYPPSSVHQGDDFMSKIFFRDFHQIPAIL